MKSINFLISTLLVLSTVFSCNSADDVNTNEDDLTTKKELPIIIAHRGAQSLFPEHTMEGYKKAIELGADFIEPDLVMTKDGHLVVRHEPMLSKTTNVADIPEFENLKTTKNLDGKMVTDWFALDFTLEEIKQLKAIQAFSGRSTEYDLLFEIPTFEEVLDLVKNSSTVSGNNVGIYPEIKHPYFHNNLLNIRMEDQLLTELEKAELNTEKASVFVQCFEVAPLKYINEISSVKLVQLISCYTINQDGTLDFNVPDGDFISFGSPYDFYVNGDNRSYEFFTTAEGMEFTASYADGIGPWKPFIISYKTDDSGDVTLLPPTNFVDFAHNNNLKVHPYTFREENTQWSNGDSENEYHLFFDAGVDGVFTDYTDDAVNALKTWEN